MKKLIALALICVMTLSSLACFAAAYPDGVFEGEGTGMNGAVKVSVTVEGGAITAVNVLSHQETPGISDPALESIPAQIIETQNIAVDAIAGATMTSDAIVEAVTNALSGTEAESEAISVTVENPDVIVVGGGMAGLCAAVRVCELGGSVVVFEQSHRVGGSANTAGGSISGTGYQAQIAAGIEDSPEKFYDDFVTMGGGIDNLNPEIAMKHAENSGPAIDWLKDYVGVEMSDTVDNGGYVSMNTPRVTYTAGGASSGGALYFLDALSAKLDESVAAGKAQVVLNAMVDDVILDDERNILGVIVGGQEYRAPSTIIATGGYGYSEKWLKEYNFTNITSNDPITAIGSGYDFARAAGAAFDNMTYSSCYGGSVPVSGFQASLRCTINYNGAIWVNTAGERMFNEPAASSMDKRTVWRTADQNIVYVVLSQSMLSDEQPLFTGMMSNSQPFDNAQKLDELIEQGYAFKADTIDELAAQIGTANLPATIAQYNADVAAGKDSVFGREDNLLAFEEGPFYAVYTIPYLMMTAGGPRINADGQLVREDASLVGNTYLAGEIIGSANIAGHNTIGGIGHGLCVTWGRISAESAMKNAGK